MSRRRIFTLIMMLAMTISVMAGNRFTLVIDAGHGGHDAGALGSSSKEKNINLKVALAFGRMVERNCPDVKVIYTRKTDVFIPLDERANIANRAKADLFISIHTNALPHGKIARGFEVYTLGMHRAADNLEVAKRENSVILEEKNYKQRYEGFDPRSSESYIIFEFMQDRNMAKSVELAKMIQKEVCAQANRPNKGVHQAGFLVLRATSMPSCLIELGFITTRDEENLLNSEQGIEAHARGIFQAFNRYKKKHSEAIVVPYEAHKKETVSVPTIVPQEETIKRNDSPKREQPQKEIKEQTPPRELQSAVEEIKPQPESVPTVRPVDKSSENRPVFKVQILTSGRSLRITDNRFKGEKGVDCYQEGNLFKYTIGSSTNYQEIYQLRKTLLSKFPEAFIIAFRNGEKMDVQQAIREYKTYKNK
ncbi:MAG: N-acetylmuramoyl-L-alanine amidase [Prevotella sp.]|nr:N-acetylmuramoyl-L-alanine amidase [Prevotella sp.]